MLIATPLRFPERSAIRRLRCGHCKQLKPIYEQLAAAFKDEPSVVIAAVNADSEKTLGSRFEVSGFPTLKFFPRGKAFKVNPLTYDGKRTLPQMVSYINDKASTFRTPSGGLSPAAGLLEDMDALAVEFVAAAADARAAVIAKAKEAAGPREAAAYYVKVMEKVAEKGIAFVASEGERLRRVKAGASITPAKSREMAVRINVLGVFEGKGAGGEESDEETESDLD